jgi:dihydrofolate synthase/folylpolyglutamate synthase
LTYEDALVALYARRAAGIKLDLAPMRAWLSALGAPQQCYFSVVVAGTNGKGSTSWAIAQGLQALGLRVGLFTSPHLLRFSERIRVDGAEIPRAAVAPLWARVERAEALCPRPGTFFEAATAMALLWFRDQAVDVAVLEVGMGGRLDATNAVCPKRLSVITAIDFDHCSFLGGTLAEIAREKGGIIEQSGTVAMAPQHLEVQQTLDAICTERGATRVAYRALPEAILPPYQHQNLSLASSALRHLGCSDAVFHTLLPTFQWPGRFMWLTERLLVDGAHNPAGLRALLRGLEQETRPIHCVYSVLRDKPVQECVAVLRARVQRFFPFPLDLPRAVSAASLTALFGVCYADVGAALAAADDGEALVLVTGSLFCVAEALRAHGATADPLIAL